MNYLCHARDHLDHAWGVAGTSLPDWLSAADRRSRVDPARAEAAAEEAGLLGEVARAVLVHLHDDRWFHTTAVFDEVTQAITADIRAHFPGRPRLRASFFGHVMMEMLLDACLDEKRPGAMEAFYARVDELEASTLHEIAAVLCPRPPQRLGGLLPFFSRARFLFGYREDDGLVRRLDGLCGRIGLPPLPEGFVSVVPAARALVRARADDLLSPS